MTARARRRRAFLLLSLALACGGLAASEVGGRVRDVEARVGSPVPVVVAARDIGPDSEVGRRDVTVRQVPERFAPPDAFPDPTQAVGARTAGALSAGAYLTGGALQGAAPEGRGAGALRRGERAVQVAVAGAEALGESASPGSRVDVLVSSEPRAGPGRSFLALEDVELLGLDAIGGGSAGGDGNGDGASGAASGVATLRVTLRQAVYLTAAQNFAREVRLLPRPPGDRGRAGRAAVAAGDL